MKYMLEDMTFLEFRARLAEDPVVILPFGSTEVQGARGPMGDFMLSTAMARRVGEATGAIVAPTVPFGVAEVFRDVPGGIQVRAETFRLLLRDMVGAFLDHGVTRLVIFNGHTGNHAPIAEVIREIRRERQVVIPWLNIWPMVSHKVLTEAFGDRAGEAAGHGAAMIGSVYEHFFPALYRNDLALPDEPAKTLLGLPTGGLATVKMGDVDVFVPINMLDHCEAVVSGDADLSNPEAGRIVSGYIVETAIALVEHMKAAPNRG